MSAPDPARTVPASPEARLAQQKDTIKQGCFSGLGCLFVLAVFAFVDAGLGPLLYFLSGPFDENTVVLADFRKLGFELFTVPLFVAAAALGVAAMFKTVRGSLVGIALFLVAAGLVGDNHWHGRFVALEFRAGAIDLRYLWPRPRQPINALEIIKVDVHESLEATVGAANVVYQLELTMSDGRRFSSYISGPMTEALQRLEKARRRK